MSNNNEIDPREIFNIETLSSIDDVEVGDVIACGSWSRGRVVELIEGDGGGRIIFLADPDERFADKPRRVTAEEFEERGGWRRYPGLSKLYRAAQAVGNAPKGKPKAVPGGGFEFL